MPYSLLLSGQTRTNSLFIDFKLSLAPPRPVYLLNKFLFMTLRPVYLRSFENLGFKEE